MQRQVKLFDGAELAGEGVTDDQGAFTFRLTPQEFGIHHLVAEFAEQDFLTAAGASFEWKVYVDTETSILFDAPVDAGIPSSLIAQVTDETGSLVVEGVVALSLDGQESTMVPVANGRTQKPLTFTKAGDVTVDADFQPGGFYLASDASARAHVTMPTRLEIEPRDDPAVYENFDVIGRLVNFFNEPLPGKEVAVDMDIKDSDGRTVTTAGGQFTVRLKPVMPGVSTLRVEFAGDGDLNGSTVEQDITVLPVVLRTSFPPFLARGLGNDFAGLVLRGDQPLNGELVELELDGLVVSRAESDAQGNVRMTVEPGLDSKLDSLVTRPV